MSGALRAFRSAGNKEKNKHFSAVPLFRSQVPNAMSMAPMAPMSAAAEAFIPSMWPMAHQMPVQPVHGMPVQPAVPIQSGGGK